MNRPRPARPPRSFDAVEQANVSGPIRLDAESVEAIAARVADLLRETPPPPLPKLVSARELARSLGVSRDWVYAHAEELGGVAIGSGDRPRLRFDPDAALATWLAFSVGKGAQEPETAAKAQVSRRRNRRSAGTGVELLPIGGEKGRRPRPERGTSAAQP